MFVAVIFALVLWVAGIIYGINLGRQRLLRMGRAEWWPVALTTVLLIPTTLLWLAVLGFRSLRLQPESEFPWSARMSQRLEAGFFLGLSVFLLVSGFILLGAVLPTGEVAALTFGIIFLGGAFVALRNHRRARAELMRRSHNRVARLYIPAIPVLAVSGALILAYGL